MTNKFQSPLQKAVVTWLTAHPETTIAGLAQLADIDKGDLSKITRALKNSLNMESAGRLAKAMGTTVEGLLSGEPEAVATAPAGAAPNAVRVETTVVAAGTRVIALKDIDASADNPRKTFDDESLKELAASIAEQGLLQPIVVRPIGKRFEIIAGERRFRALKLNKAAEALCVVREGDDDGNARALRIIENLQRADIKPVEEAEAFAALNELDPVKWNATAIGRAIGKSDRFVAQRIAVARNLHDDLKAKLAKGELKIEVARVMATAPQKLQKALSNDYYALRSADDCRRKLQDKAIPLSAASFKVEEYDGEFLEEDGKRWFADKAKFSRLQTKAADGRVERLKKDYPSASRVNSRQAQDYVFADNGDRVGGYAYYGEKRRTEAKKKKKGLTAADCTTIVWIDGTKIMSAKNVVLRDIWDAKTEKEKPEVGQRREQPHRDTKEEKEARAVNNALTAALAERPDLAKRVLAYAFFGTNSADFEFHVDPRPYLGGDVFEPLTEFVSDSGYYGERYEVSEASEDKLWATLRAMEDGAIDRLIGRLLSEAVHIYAHGMADGRTRSIAAELGVEIPARFVPKVDEADAAQTDDEAQQEEATA